MTEPSSEAPAPSVHTHDASEGDSARADASLTWEDVPHLMQELRDLAQALQRRWPHTESLHPTLLVNEALCRQRRKDQPWDEVQWSTRGQFFGQMFRAMRQCLIDYRRHQQTRKYRARRNVSVVDLDQLAAAERWTEDEDLAMALEAGLSRLHAEHPELAEVVEYRFFTQQRWTEVARMMGLDPATVKRRWQRARIIIEAAIRAELGRSA